MLHSRIQRIGHTLQKAIGEILLNELTDPRLKFVSVAHVEMTKDLQSALVFVSLLSDEPEKAKAAMAALESAKGYIKSLLRQRVILKFMPDLKFRIHEGARHAAEIDKLLRDLASQRPPDEEKTD
jgi:ribosome-binding factor A